MIEKIRLRLYEIMEKDDLVMARIIDILLLVLILLNVIVVLLETGSAPSFFNSKSFPW